MNSPTPPACPWRAAAWTLTALFAVAVAASVFRIPIQVSDSHEILEAVDAMPSVSAAFTEGIRSSTTMLRPLRQVQTKLLLNLSHALGDRYNLVFRGFHALTAALLIVMFTAVLRPRTLADVAALAFALTVLTGLHTFPGMTREAYPVNHFLLIAIYCVAIALLAQSRGGLLVDVAAVLCFVLAALTLESGLVVFPLAVAAYVAGRRGISRGALAAMAVLFLGYVYLRVGYLQMEGNALGERPTGFGLEILDGAKLRERFGDRPWVLYAYTVVSSILTVPLSQPVIGQWSAIRAWTTDNFHRVYPIEIITSLGATTLILWYLTRRDPATAKGYWREPMMMMFGATLVGSAVLSYAYAKSEIMSAAGVFYALVAFAAAREALVRFSATRFTVPSVVLLAAAGIVCGGWGVRALGLHYKLQRGALAARSEWVQRMPPYAPAATAPGAEGPRLAAKLREQALQRGRTNPYLLHPRAESYWGED